MPKYFKFINSKNKTITIDKYDNFGIPNVIRFSFLNINKTQLNVKETNIHLAKSKNGGSYLINDLTIDNYHEIRVHRRRREIYKFLDKESLNIGAFSQDCFSIYKSLENLSLSQMKKLKDVPKMITFNNQLFSEKILNIRYYANYIHDKPIFSEKEFICCTIYCILQLLELNAQLGLIAEFFSMSLTIKEEDNLDFDRKINLLYGYFRKSSEDAILIKDCKIINFNKINKNCAYSKAHDFIKNIMENITLNSKLFKFFYLCNSGCCSNRLIKDQTTFKLSMISEKIIKSHLIKLLPECCFSFYNPNENACRITFTEDRVSFLNEGALFSKKKDELDELLLINDDIKCEYTIPLVMIILHEYYGHSKNAYHYKKTISPNYINSNDKFTFSDELENEKLTKTCKIKKYSLSMNGECGRTLEFIISPDRKIIYTLKFSYISMENLLNVNLWISNTFDQLNDAVNIIINQNQITFDEEKLKTFLPGFPEDISSVEKVSPIEQIFYNSDDNYDSDDFKYAKIAQNKKIYFRDWKV